MYRLGNNILTLNNKPFYIGGVVLPYPIDGLVAQYEDSVNNHTASIYNSPDITTVTQWDDLSGNNHHLASTVSSCYTTLKRLYFDRNSLYCDNFITGKNITFFSVMNSANLSAANTYWGFYNTLTTLTDGYILIKYPLITENGFSYTQNYGGTSSIELHVLQTTTNINNFIFTKNNVSILGSLSGSDWGKNPANANYYQVCYKATNHRAYWKAHMIYDRALSTAEITQVTNYLKTKYSIY